MYDLDNYEIPDWILKRIEEKRKEFRHAHRHGTVNNKGTSEDFDDQNTISDWTMFIVKILGNAWNNGQSNGSFRHNMAKVAALAIAAMEASARGIVKDRHFDP